MTNEPSPRPWRAIYARVLDARGKTVCVCEKDSMHGTADDETAKADAALIVNAANHMDYDLSIRFELNDARAEIDELRDLVRRMADSMQGIMDAADGKGEGVLDESLLREARAAIGEDKP